MDDFFKKKLVERFYFYIIPVHCSTFLKIIISLDYLIHELVSLNMVSLQFVRIYQ